MYRNSGHRPGPNTPFIQAARQIAAQLELQPTSAKEAQYKSRGRTWAAELIQALRAGDKTPALLSAGVMLSGRNQEPEVMAGFLDELAQAIAEGAR